jgi:hypothetical protein
LGGVNSFGFEAGYNLFVRQFCRIVGQKKVKAF